MASATELFNIGSSVDPYGKFREAQLAPMQYDIKQANLEEQLKEIRQDQEAQKQQEPGLGTMGGGATMPSGQLSGMAKTINPNWKLVDDNGMPTTAGQINDFTLQSIEEGKAGARLMKQAKFMEPGSKDQINTISEGRRLLNSSMMYRNKAVEIARNTQNDAIYAAATAKDQTQWDNAIKAYQESGLPIPQGIPTEYTPDNVKKIAQLAPAALQSKISNDLLKQRQEERLVKSAELRDQKVAAALRDGISTGTEQVYESVDDKLNDPRYGVAKGKIPAKEQTIARRIMADSSEVLVGVNQLKHLTESGTRDLSGSTFSEAKGDGFLKAPAKAFTNKISNEDSLMYDSIMYPIVKNMSLFDNPDYRPTDADVKQKMQAYKAGANEPRSVQVQKMAELKNTYMAKAESYLDAGILNANQAAALKKQMRGIEKAIPWNVNDAIDFSRQTEYKQFGDFLKAKGVQNSSSSESVSVGGKTYSRPANMSNADWADYKKAVGAK